MICPLMSDPKVFGQSAEGFTPCQREECAWWSFGEECAMAAIAREIWEAARGGEAR